MYTFCHGQACLPEALYLCHDDIATPVAALYVCILCREANDTCATYT